MNSALDHQPVRIDAIETPRIGRSVRIYGERTFPRIDRERGREVGNMGRDILTSIGPYQLFALFMIGSGLITLVGVLTREWRRLHLGRAEIALKEEMVRRGMSAEEIERVLGASGPAAMAKDEEDEDEDEDQEDESSSESPTASEVVVERGGNWLPAIVLQSEPGTCLVHFVGTSMARNEWVGADRVRYPACAVDVASLVGSGRSGVVEVVVEQDEEWYPALLLRARDRSYYVHFIGNDADSNEWVEESRVRFPADQAAAGADAGAGPVELRNGPALEVIKGPALDPDL
jgi:hypothetical protein